jgi:2-oxoglutarate ferredoxin oxidoreductase subunit beta
MLKKLEGDYDPTDRWQALHILEEAQRNNWLVTGLLYVDPDQPAMFDYYNLSEKPLNRLTEKSLRPNRDTLEKINASMV